MFEEQYRKFCREIKPSEALNDETLALMKEARDHRTTPTPNPLRWKPALVLPVAGTAIAAVIALVIVGVWLTHGGGNLEEEIGDMDIAFNDSIAGSSQGDDSNDDYDSAIKDFLDENAPSAKPDDNSTGTVVGGSNDNSGNSGTTDSFNSTGSSDLNGSTGNSDNSSSSPSDEENKNESTEDEPSEPIAPEDAPEPYGPEISQEKNIETYLTVREFIDALTQKTAPGYGSNYYNARELLIIPNLLPDGARFRHLHLDSRTGKYSYSYHFTKDGKDYIIDVDVNVVTPKNLNELRLYKGHIADEQILTGAEGDRLYYQFGEQDLVTVTLTDVTATAPLTAEETAALLKQFQLERCSLLNPVLDMKY